MSLIIRNQAESTTVYREVHEDAFKPQFLYEQTIGQIEIVRIVEFIE